MNDHFPSSGSRLWANEGTLLNYTHRQIILIVIKILAQSVSVTGSWQLKQENNLISTDHM